MALLKQKNKKKAYKMPNFYGLGKNLQNVFNMAKIELTTNLFLKYLIFTKHVWQFDARVQEVLDTYWPKTTELTNIKRDWSNVYTAILENGQKCIVKAGINNKEGSGARSSG